MVFWLIYEYIYFYIDINIQLWKIITFTEYTFLVKQYDLLYVSYPRRATDLLWKL